MTRPIEQIEADLVTARQAHQGVVATHQQAVRTAVELRARTIAGDSTVTAQALAEAQHAAEHAELPIPAKLEAITVLEAEKLVATTERWAAGVSATEPALRADFEQAFEAYRTAADALVAAWRLHASYVIGAATDVGQTVGADVSPRVKRAFHGHTIVDGVPLRTITVLVPIERLNRETVNRLVAGQPKAMR